MTPPAIAESAPEDGPAIAALYRKAFPEEDLVPLVRALSGEGPAVLSLKATVEGALAGHGLFSRCAVGEEGGAAALLGPLAVAAAFRRRGVARALVAVGNAAMEKAGARAVCVLGDPVFYGRLGFAPERGIRPPYQLPEAWRDAWQSIHLAAGAPPVGDLRPPAPWLQPSLWLP